MSICNDGTLIKSQVNSPLPLTVTLPLSHLINFTSCHHSSSVKTNRRAGTLQGRHVRADD